MLLEEGQHWLGGMFVKRKVAVTCVDVLLEDNLEAMWAARPHIYYEMMTYVTKKMEQFKVTGEITDYTDTHDWREFMDVVKNLFFQGTAHHADDLELLNALGLWSGQKKAES